ncbi:MAG: cell division protein BolA [Lysobacteraceae bacterium]|nr:MAG: cell division protein BolA [Xanthomonadaceae bacterium]
MSDRVARIEARLREALQPTRLEIRDDSHRHVGHEGARDGRGHFAVEIVSPAFEGLGLLARHRLVHAALEPLLKTDIHALQIRALSPSEMPRKG